MSSKESDENLVYSDVPISVPIVIPSMEDSDLNGFSFSKDMGIMVASNRPQDSKDILRKLRGWNW